MPPVYWVLRVDVWAEGVILLVIVFLPGQRYDPSPYSRGLRSVLVAGTVLVAVSYMLPNRWGIGNVLFWARSSVMIAALARVVQMSVALAGGKFGEKHWLLYPVLVVALLGVVAAPILLIWRRRRFISAAFDSLRGGLPAAS